MTTTTAFEDRIPFSMFIQFQPRSIEPLLTKITNYLLTGQRSIRDIEKNGVKIKIKNMEFTVTVDEALYAILNVILKFI